VRRVIGLSTFGAAEGQTNFNTADGSGETGMIKVREGRRGRPLFCRLYKKGLNPPNRLVPAIKSV
jgi:hypothetical protein